MRTSAWTAAAALLALAAPPGVAAGNWTLRDDIYGNGFFNAFTWWDYADPTHGYVKCVAPAEAWLSPASSVLTSRLQLCVEERGTRHQPLLRRLERRLRHARRLVVDPAVPRVGT